MTNALADDTQAGSAKRAVTPAQCTDAMTRAERAFGEVLAEVLRVEEFSADSHFFDELGVIDENIPEIDDADADNVSVLCQFAEHFQRVLAQGAERPAFEALVGAGMKLVAARPHATMLRPGLAGVNVGECWKAQA